MPQRSPFRYPGGKTWLVPVIRRWLTSLPQKPVEFIEPFAGGAIVGLTTAFEQLADHVTLVEVDSQVAAVWLTIIESGDGEWLAQQIEDFQFTPQRIQSLLEKTELSVREQALQTIVKNRINRGGILAPGAGKLKNGENGKGLASRWYPHTLRKRIVDIVKIRDRLTFVHGDGLAMLRQAAGLPDRAYFIDPPYTAAGKRPGNRLYMHHDLDHRELFTIVSTLTGDFLMTYDNNEHVTALAQEFGFDTRIVPMNNTHHARLTELLVGRDLSWLS
ncbi:MAG: DNA adenine methylase [Chloroflexi bacterium]|nr:DNA adenine methylase [Chloroflexota bacterium]